MKKNKIILYSIVIFLVGLIITGGSYAFWSWASNTNKNIVFNTAQNLKNYIVYDEGDSSFTGELNVSNNYLTGSIHSTISIYKTQAAANVNLVATIHMDINQIGENMKKSTALKWVVTEGKSTNPGTVLAKGNFIGTNNGDTLTLVPDIPVTTTETFYTIWIWLDSSENPSDDLSGETLDTNVWTEVNQLEGSEDRYEITRISANYQTISATVVDSKYKITNYKVTTVEEEPTSWENIASADQANVYNLNTSQGVNGSGTYYVWFKDANNRIRHSSVQVTAVDTSAPSCVWGTFNPTQIKNGNTSQITLTCTDSQSGISVYNLKTTDITVSNNKVNVTDITKTSVTSGYQYTITVTGTNNDGTSTLTLDNNLIKNGVGLGNASVTSGNITVLNESVITINAGVGISSITGTSITYNSTTGQATGTFNNGSTIDLSDLTITYKTGYSGANYTKTSGEGSLSGSTFTVGSGTGIITINATTLATPTCTISGGATNVYNYEDLTLTATNDTNYDSEVTLAYQFGYTATSNGTLSNFANGTNNTYNVAANSHIGTRYYGTKVTATGDGGLTSTCTTASGSYAEITLVNARIDFDATTNGGTISGTTPLYVPYGLNAVYTGRISTTTGSIPTATKTGYTFNGWFTSSSGGTKVINADGTVVASVANWTNPYSYWILTNPSDTLNTNRLYAQFTVNDYTVTADADGGTIPTTSGWTLGSGNTTATKTVTYDSPYGTLPTPTKPGYTFLGWNGKNLFNEEAWLMAISGATYTNNHYVFSNYDIYSKYDKYGSLPSISFKSNTRYTYSWYGYLSGGSIRPEFNYTDESHDYLLFNLTAEGVKSITSSATKSLAQNMKISYGSAGTSYITHVQLEEGTTATAFEPYYVLSTTNVTQTKDHTLTAKWQSNTYTITLNNNGATTAGTGTIYEKYDTNICLDSNCTTVMSTAENPITVPTRTDYIFDGYYDSTTQMIDANGYVTAAFANNKYASNKTLVAKWLDNIPPVATIVSSSNTLKSATQTVSLQCTGDPTKVYFGTNSNPSENEFDLIDGSPSTWSNTNQTIDEDGTYYLICKDDSGNVSNTPSVTYYKYTVITMLGRPDGMKEYTNGSLGYEQVLSEDYIAKPNTTMPITSIYTVPTYTKADRIKGCSLGAPSSSVATLSNDDVALSDNNSIYTIWFARNYIFFRYKANGGTVTTPTTQNGTTYVWGTESGTNYITRKKSTSSTVYNYLDVGYIGRTWLDLVDYNDPTYLNITRTGYTAVSGAEWICESGCIQNGITLSQAEMAYDTYNLCDGEHDQCDIVLKVNWQQITSIATPTITRSPASGWTNGSVVLTEKTTTTGINKWQFTYAESPSGIGSNANTQWVTMSCTSSTCDSTGCTCVDTYSAAMNKNAYIRACIDDLCSAKASSLIQIDKTAPTIALSSNSDSTYTKTKSVTVTLKDTASGLKAGNSVKYGWSTSTSTAPSSYTTATLSYDAGTTGNVTFTASGSGLTGSYYLWVVPNTLKDVANNSNTTTTKSTGTFKFDNTAPTGSISGSRLGTTVEASFSGITESHSGINKYYFLLTTASSCPAAGSSYTPSSTNSYTFSSSSSGTYYVCGYLKDTAGNISSVYRSTVASYTSTVATISNISVYENNGPNNSTNCQYGYTYVANSANGDTYSFLGYNGSYSYVPIVTVALGSGNTAKALDVTIKGTNSSTCTTTSDTFYADVIDSITYDRVNNTQSSRQIATYAKALDNSSNTYTGLCSNNQSYSISSKVSFHFNSSRTANFVVPVTSSASTLYLVIWGHTSCSYTQGGQQFYFNSNDTYGYVRVNYLH